MERHSKVFQLFAVQPENMVETHMLGNLLRHVGYSLTEGEIQDLIHYHNKSHFTFEEFIEISEKVKQTEITQEELRRAFQAFDPSSSGYISIGQLKGLLMDGKEKLDENEVDELVRILNPDSDGKVNYESFIKRMY